MLKRFAILKNIVQQFFHAKEGVAIIEVSAYLPVFFLIMMFCSDYARFTRTERHLAFAAQAVAQAIAAQTTEVIVSDDNTNPSLFSAYNGVRSADVNFQEGNDNDNIAENIINFTITNVVFTPTVSTCTSSCTYNANVAWTFNENQPITGSSAITRSCSSLTALADGAAPSSTGIPSSLFNAGSVIVVDAQYKFTPLFQHSGIPSLVMTEQGFSAATNANIQNTPNGTAAYLIGVNSSSVLAPTTNNFTYCSGYPQ